MADLSRSVAIVGVAESDEIGKVDLLLAVAGGGPTIDLPDLNRLVENISPRVVIPMHFTNENCTYTRYTADDFARGRWDQLQDRAGHDALAATGFSDDG